jgi:hypothetical protein
MEETASHSPHCRSLSSCHIPQTSQNHQKKIFINCPIFSSEFVTQNASVIRKQAALLSLAGAPDVLSWGKSRWNSSSVRTVV